MATYAEIIAAIDTAIVNWAGKPVTITSPDGRSVTYRRLEELIEARKYYIQLSTAERLGRPFNITNLKSPGIRT